MVMTDIWWDLYVPVFPAKVSSTTSGSANTLNTAWQKLAFIFQAPKTWNISKLGFRTNTVTTGTATCDIRLETVDTATWFPTWTLAGTNSNGNSNIASSDDNVAKETTLTSACAVTKWDLLAMVIVPSGTFNMLLVTFSDWWTYGFPNVASFDGSVRSQWTNSAPFMTVWYDDGTYPTMLHIYPIGGNSTATFSSSSTPDEIGNAITIPFNCKVKGVRSRFDQDWNCDIILYDTDWVTVLGTIHTYTNLPSDTNAQLAFWLFSSEITLSAWSTYRLVLQPTSATSIAVQFFDFHSAAARNQLSFWSSIKYTTAKNPSGIGSWTDTTTRIANLGLIIGQIDNWIIEHSYWSAS